MLTTLNVTTRVAFTGAVRRTDTFGLRNSEYIIKSIDGLGPVKAEYTSISNTTDPGGQNLAPKDVQRNIVITIGFAPRKSTGSSVESLRRALYGMFMPKSKIELKFNDDVLGSWMIKGQVETHEPAIFSKDPEVQISILCGDPYFYKDAPEVVYTIPFDITLGANAPYFTMPYENDVPLGFVYEGYMRTSNTFLYLVLNSFPTNSLPPEGIKELWQAQMRLNMQFAPNDFVSISSVRGARGATVKKGTSAPVNVMQYFIGSLVNMQLQPGPNSFWNSPTVTGGTLPGRPLLNGVIRYKRATGGL